MSQTKYEHRNQRTRNKVSAQKQPIYSTSHFVDQSVPPNTFLNLYDLTAEQLKLKHNILFKLNTQLNLTATSQGTNQTTEGGKPAVKYNSVRIIKPTRQSDSLPSQKILSPKITKNDPMHLTQVYKMQQPLKLVTKIVDKTRKSIAISKPQTYTSRGMTAISNQQKLEQPRADSKPKTKRIVSASRDFTDRSAGSNLIHSTPLDNTSNFKQQFQGADLKQNFHPSKTQHQAPKITQRISTRRTSGFDSKTPYPVVLIKPQQGQIQRSNKEALQIKEPVIKFEKNQLNQLRPKINQQSKLEKNVVQQTKINLSQLSQKMIGSRVELQNSTQIIEGQKIQKKIAKTTFRNSPTGKDTHHNRFFSENERSQSPTTNPQQTSKKPLILKKSLIQKFLNIYGHKTEPMHPEAAKICEIIKLQPEMPTTIDLYKIGKVLGQGGFGKVNLGLHRLTRKLVAIKSIKVKEILDENDRKKVFGEIEILTKLRHQNHIKVLETVLTDQCLCIVMELCPGGDLLSYVRKRKKLSEIQTKYIYRQIVKGIAHMHENSIIHRDIKLENILLDGHGQIKIGDFGVSKIVEHHNEILFEQCGTPIYIAPEIIREHGYFGQPADVWSSGICLWAMIYGNVPFKQIPQEGNRNQFDYTLDFQSAVQTSDEFKSLISQILTIDVSKRLTPEQILNHQWLADTPDYLDIFDEQEKDLIRREFTKGFTQIKDSLPNIEQIDGLLNTEFTEFSIHSDKDNQILLKNSSSKSLVYCPFSTPHRQEDMDKMLVPFEFEKLLVPSDQMKYSHKVREANREYEKFNNIDFDNGVYHKFAYTNQPKVQRKDDQQEQKKKSKPKAITYQGINKYIVSQICQRFGCWSESYIQNCVMSNKLNYCTSTYYLMQFDQNF